MSPQFWYLSITQAFRPGGMRVSEGEVGLEFHLADWEISLKIFWMTVVSQFWDKFGMKLFYAHKKTDPQELHAASSMLLKQTLLSFCGL